jgi:very-short-patch-repair endonuclease
MTRRKEKPIVKKLRGYWSIVNPPVVEREFVKNVGEWWLRFHGYSPHVQIGAVYVADFANIKKQQVIYITERKKTHRDILRHEQLQKFEELRQAYLNRNGWAILYLEADEVFRDGDNMAHLVKEWHKDPAKFNEKYSA